MLEFAESEQWYILLHELYHYTFWYEPETEEWEFLRYDIDNAQSFSADDLSHRS